LSGSGIVGWDVSFGDRPGEGLLGFGLGLSEDLFDLGPGVFDGFRSGEYTGR
jgi:hypothetical protein